MRFTLAAILAIACCPAIAGEIDDAQKMAVTGRDAYWSCLAREYPRDTNRTMSDQEFADLIAHVCSSERQNFRVSVIDFLALKSPEADTANHLDTAKRAIEVAQKDIVSAFVKRRARAMTK